jgi:hypothetical protein
MNITQIKETCLYFTKAGRSAELLPSLARVANDWRSGGSAHLSSEPEAVFCFVLIPQSSRTKISPPSHYGSGKYHFAFEVEASAYEAHKTELQQKGIVITDLVNVAQR